MRVVEVKGLGHHKGWEGLRHHEGWRSKGLRVP